VLSDTGYSTSIPKRSALLPRSGHGTRIAEDYARFIPLSGCRDREEVAELTARTRLAKRRKTRDALIAARTAKPGGPAAEWKV